MKNKIEKIFIQKEKLDLDEKMYRDCVKRYTIDVLKEDTGRKGDITTNVLFKRAKKKRAIIKARNSGILAGIEEVKWFLEQNKLKVKLMKKDGVRVKKGDRILTITGNVKDILKTERVALNVLSRMSGIATETLKLKITSKGKVLICPTRKTLWSLMDKKACVVGGGGTHRLGLWNFILIKDNHLELLKNDVDKALNPLKRSNSIVEIEVENRDQAVDAAKHNPDIIMFDNFKAKKIRKVISRIDKKYPDNDIIFEASGGINKYNVKKYSNSGVDVISLGYLTHSVKSLDFSLSFL
ncbi:MAG: carboxylating nicotinate-nucleotide diphosphorylase [Patescibacteria group bacterium]